MIFFGILSGIWFLLYAFGYGVAWLVAWRRKRKVSWRRALVVAVATFAAWWLLVVPETLGALASRFIGTRHFERDYVGPTCDADGRLTADGEHRIEPVFFETSDGLRIRGFWAPGPFGNGRRAWVLTHGLFRNALEVEPVARMLHELEQPVLFVEVRNHGGSDRATPSFGLRESRDVAAAARWLRQQGHADRIVLFGVSLGSIASSIAAPEVEGLAGLVLDAPIQDLESAATNSLRRGPRRVPVVPWPIGDLTLGALQRWSDVSFDDVRPGDAVRGLRPDVPVLLVAAGKDFRVTVAEVEALHESLGSRSTLRVAAESTHGRVWLDRPGEYFDWLREFAARVR